MSDELMAAAARVSLLGLGVALVWWWRRDSAWRSRGRTATHWELAADGSRPEDLAVAGAAMAAALDAIKSQGAGLVIHRWSADGVARVAITVWGARSPRVIVDAVANAVGAKAAALEHVPLPLGRGTVLAQAQRRDWVPGGPDNVITQLGLVPTRVAESFARAAGDAFVSVSIQPVRRWEVHRLRRWIDARSGARRSVGAGEARGVESVLRQRHVAALSRCRVVAGAPDTAAALDLAGGFAHQVPAFDFEVRPELIGDRLLRGALSGIAGLVAALYWLADARAAAAAVGATALALLMASAAGHLGPSVADRRRRRLLASAGLIPGAPPHYVSLRRAVVAVALTARDWDKSRPGPQHSNCHPHRRDLICLAPPQVAALCALAGPLDVNVATAETLRRQAPPAVRSSPGARIGYDPDGWAVRIPDRDRHLGVFCAGDPGTGKALGVHERVPTPCGWSTMGKLQPGDRVFDDAGNPTEVVAVSEVMIGRECFEVAFSDGTRILADGDHLWRTETVAGRLRRRRHRYRRPVRRPLGTPGEVAAVRAALAITPAGATTTLPDLGRELGWYPRGPWQRLYRWSSGGLPAMPARNRLFDRTGVLEVTLRRLLEPQCDQRCRTPRSVPITTRAIRDSLRIGGKLNHAVPVAPPLRLATADLPIEPRLLGLWLGDGDSAGAGFTTADPELLADFAAVGYVTRFVSRCHYSISRAPAAEAGSARVPALAARLRALGVLGNKHIPRPYLRSSEDQRRQLLSGLLDTDGTVDPGGQVVFTSTSARLSQDVHELACSLGYRATMREGRAKLGGRDCGPKWDVAFSTMDEVFGLRRKQEAHRTRHRGTTSARTGSRYIVDVRPVGSIPVRCIQVTNPSGMFLVGPSMIPTHNSTMLTHLWGSDLVARAYGVEPGAGPQRRGRMALIWLETKGDGAARAAAMAQRVGYGDDHFLLLDVTATSGSRLELLDRSDPDRMATAFVEAMRYAFEPGAIMEASAGVLTAAIRVALAATACGDPEIARANPISLALTLLGGDAEPAAQAALLDRLRARVTEPSPVGATSGGIAAAFAPVERPDEPALRGRQEDPLAAALRGFDRYMNMAPRERNSLFEPSRNKLGPNALGAAGRLFAPDPTRRTVTFREILTHHGVAIVNFGGTQENSAHTDLLAQRLASMALYLLWDEIQASCPNWQAEGRSVGVFSDELSDISGRGSKADVIMTMFDQGRARGVQLALATQRLGQLPERTQEAALSMGAKVYLGHENLTTATEAARDITGDTPGSFGPRDIREMPPMQGAARLRIGGEAQAPFTLLIPPDDSFDRDSYWEDRR